MSNFHKRKQTINVPGSRISLQNGQVLVSSGNPSLDAILGGGLQIGSIILIEEDKYVTYSRSLIKYYLADGAIHKHSMFLASLDEDTKELAKKIPSPCTDPSANAQDKLLSTNDQSDMRIAWRYNDLPKVDSEQRSVIGYNFDLTRPINEVDLNQLDISYFDENQDIGKGTNLFENVNFVKLISSLKDRLTSSSGEIDKDNESKNFLRICLQSLGSPLWYTDQYARDICLFLTILKALVRSNLCVCMITMPVHLLEYLDAELVHRIRNLVDYSIELESFAGSDKETNPVFKEYNGLLHIRRSIALNTLAAFTPETYDLAFKLRRKKFTIEKLHLPPELQEPDQTAQNDIVASLSCGSSTKHLLEF